MDIDSDFIIISFTSALHILYKIIVKPRECINLECFTYLSIRLMYSYLYRSLHFIKCVMFYIRL